MNSHEDLNTNWRKVASTIYQKPTDSKIYGTVELDVTEIEKYISKKRKAGVKTTITYLMTLILGRAIRQDVMELNAYVKRGKIIQRDQVDATVSVLLKGGQMGSVKVENADRLTTEEISSKIGKRIADSRKGNENEDMQSKSMLSSIPWPLRNWVFRLFRTLTIKWGISMPGIGLNPNGFGSFMVSNIVSVGLDTGYASLLPSSNISFIMVLGNVIKKPVVINDEIVIRRIMSISATLDHRVVDGSHGGRMFRIIKHLIKNPELLDIAPE